ncbi:hypothetical protein BO82DRAFT_51781 [Aspergillus uvarum CBS 121591]|uniref:Uncharacterized protein n=1 Tax=Aspergillus uvarum CBS 121591 TaxID=1448315 RepID=A0A319CMU7_9EURO|nr:hypothetical protein BO82DRAFT_51781 [Aspergillus uvarum CBS 121591]PYH86806.1 hypothetical protein BO82DRAFT_51781 [Aspergillus uvarum CBS 121591]
MYDCDLPRWSKDETPQISASGASCTLILTFLQLEEGGPRRDPPLSSHSLFMLSMLGLAKPILHHPSYRTCRRDMPSSSGPSPGPRTPMRHSSLSPALNNRFVSGNCRLLKKNGKNPGGTRPSVSPSPPSPRYLHDAACHPCGVPATRLQ